jgi:hypothetical protein
VCSIDSDGRNHTGEPRVSARSPTRLAGTRRNAAKSTSWRSGDESFYVLEAKLAFICGDKWLKAGPGTFVFGPRQIAHGFKVSTGTDDVHRGTSIPSRYGQAYAASHQVRHRYSRPLPDLPKG